MQSWRARQAAASVFAPHQRASRQYRCTASGKTTATLATGHATTVAGEVAAPEPEEDWRSRLEHVAHQNWALYRRHPWMLEVTSVRPALGPNMIAKYDAELRAIEGVGLTEIEMDAVVGLVAGHVEGVARRALEKAQLERTTGMTEDEWWAAAAPVLAEVADFGRFPTAVRVGTAAGEAHGGYDP